MEEINNTYVAMTRAANNLFVYVENPRKLKLGDKMCWKGSNYEFYELPLLKATNSDNIKDLIKGIKRGELFKVSTKKINRSIDLTGISNYFKGTSTKPSEDKKLLNYEMNKKRLIGTIAHDYLEYIKYNKEKEHKTAENIIRDSYVNIVGEMVINNIVKVLKKYIKTNQALFDPKYEVFTEYTLYQEDQIKRIDRLMVDKKNKVIKIVDYKTGKYHKEEQLTEYALVLKNKLEKDYKIKTEFIDIKL